MAYYGGTSSQSEDCVFRRLWEMWRDVWSTDVNLECQDYVFPVHSVILAASSKYFRMMLTNKTPSGRIIVIAGIPASVLSQILIFMYKGTLTLPTNSKELRLLLHGAHTLQVHDLCRDFHLLFASVINSCNYQELWTLAAEYRNDRCIKCVIDFVISNYAQVWINPNFIHLSAKQILDLAKHSAKERISHSILLQSIREWIANNHGQLTNSHKHEFENLLQDLADRDFTAEDCFYFGDQEPNSRIRLTMENRTCPSRSQVKESPSRDEQQPNSICSSVLKTLMCKSKDKEDESLDKQLVENKIQSCVNCDKTNNLNHKTLTNMVYIMTNSGVDIERIMGTEAFTELLQYIEEQDRDMARGFTQILNTETIRKKASVSVSKHGRNSFESGTKNSNCSMARSEESDSAVLQSIASCSKALVTSNPETLSEIITPLRRPTSNVSNSHQNLVKSSERDIWPFKSPSLQSCCNLNEVHDTKSSSLTRQNRADNASPQYVKDSDSHQVRSQTSTFQAGTSASLCQIPIKTMEGENYPNAKDSVRLSKECARACNASSRTENVPSLELRTVTSLVDNVEHKPAAENVLSWKRENGVIRVTTGCQTSPRIVRFNCRRFLRAMAYQVNEIMYTHDQNNERRFTVPQELFKGFSLHEALSWTRAPRPRNPKTVWSTSVESVIFNEFCDDDTLVNAIENPLPNNSYMFESEELRNFPINDGISNHSYNGTAEKVKVIECDEDSASDTNENAPTRCDLDSHDNICSSALSSLTATCLESAQKKHSTVTLRSSPTKSVLKIPHTEETTRLSGCKPSDGKSKAKHTLVSSSSRATKLSLRTSETKNVEIDDDERDLLRQASKPVYAFSGSPRRETVIAVIGRKKHGEATMLYFNADTQKWISADNLQQSLKSIGYDLMEKSCCVSCNQTVYLIGGVDNQDVCRSTVLALTPESQPPTHYLESLQVPRHSAGAALFQNHIYVLGGISTDGHMLSHMERYSILKNSWRSMPPLPVCGWGMSLVVAGSYLLSIGGRRHSEWSLNCYKYEPVEQQWTRMCKIPSEFSLCHAPAVFFNNRVYAFRQNNLSPKGNIAILNPHVLMWLLPDTVGQLPPRRVVTAFVFDNKVWVMDAGARLFKFDPSTLKWEIDYPFFRSMTRPLYVVLIARSLETERDNLPF